MTKNKKIMFYVLLIFIIVAVLAVGILIKNKLKTKKAEAMYQLDTSSAWSIAYNKNANFLVELTNENNVKITAIGANNTSIKITCSNEKNEEIVLKAIYDEKTGVKIEKEGNQNDMKVTIKVNNQNFSAILYDNEASKKLLEKLPLKLTMDELNENEKYCYLDTSLPTNSAKVGKINKGDIMLYTSNCLVLFYDSFETSYSYTKIGYIEDVEGLKEALGSGNVQIEISK